MSNGNLARIGVSVGHALFRAAAEYPRLSQVILEAVQNGLDSSAKVIEIEIDQRRNTRTISVRDNGVGASRMQFNAKLGLAYETVKEHDKLGQFGIGLFSPLGKCERFYFTSRSIENGEPVALRWRFECKDIQNKREVEIPIENTPLSVLRARSGAAHGIQQWSTELRILRYSTDREIGKLEMGKLRQDVLDIFGNAMRRLDVSVWIYQIDESGNAYPPIVVRQSEYLGRPLDEVVLHHERGDAEFRLYVVPRHEKRKGRVTIGVADNLHRVPFSDLSHQLASLDFLPEEVVKAFLSGVFEGEILHSGITLRADRKTFLEDEALLRFCTQIEEWFESRGRGHIERAQNTRRDERNAEISKRVLTEIVSPFIEARQAEFGTLLQRLVPPTPAVATQQPGIQEGSAERGRRAPIIVAREVPANASVPPQPKGKKKSAKKQKARAPIAGSPEQRALVSSGSLDLRFSLEDLGPLVWRYDRAGVTLSFNDTHPLWERCESNEQHLMQYQAFIANGVLNMQLMPAHEQASHQSYLDRLIECQVDFITGSKTPRRGIGRKPT